MRSGYRAGRLHLGSVNPVLAICAWVVLFDGGRKLFEKGKAIRDAQKAKMEKRAWEQGFRESLEQARREREEQGLREGREKGRLAERERIRKVLELRGVVLSPEVSEAVFENRPEENP